MNLSEISPQPDLALGIPFDGSATYAPPYDALLGHIDAVIGEWREMAHAEPWSNMPPSHLVDSLPEILPKLFRLAGAGAPRIDEALSEVIAESHGYFRRLDNLPLAAVADEWNFVKRACWKVLRRAGIDDGSAATAMQRLDSLCDDAIGFSLRGYYAPELDMLRGKGLERRDGAGERRLNPPTRRES